MSPEETLFLFLAIICWGTAAWLFWKWDIGFYRSSFEQRLRKRKKPAIDENKERP